MAYRLEMFVETSATTCPARWFTFHSSCYVKVELARNSNFFQILSFFFRLDSPSSEEDDDMEDEVAPSFVDEEDSLDDTPIKRIRLDEKLQEYLKMAREAPILPQK